jgi:hypothetical protein
MLRFITPACCLTLLAMAGTATSAGAQQRGMPSSESTKLTTMVTLDARGMARLAEESEHGVLSIPAVIRGAGSLRLSGASSELELVMVHIENGEVVGIFRSRPFSMRGNSRMSLQEVMYGEEKPPYPAVGKARFRIDEVTLVKAGRRGVSAADAMKNPKDMLRSRTTLLMPAGSQRVDGVIVVAVPTDERSLSSAIVYPAGLFLRDERHSGP